MSQQPATTAAQAAPVANVIVPKRWRRLAAVVAPLWADNNEGSILSTLAPVIIAAISLPLAAVGILTSIAKFVSIVFGPIWAFVARKTNRKMTFVVATAMTGILTALTGLSQDYTHIIIFYGLSAVFVAAALPIVSEITTDLFDEKSRGRASGYTWGAISLLGSIAGPLIGQLANVEDGWRYGFFIWGGLTFLTALIMLFFFKDPGLGASEPTTSMMTAEQRAANERITGAKLRQMFAIPTFTLMLVQRLISGHLLIASFGIIFLVQEYGFDTAVAAIVTLPFGIGYLVGTFGGGLVTDALQRRFPRAGRIGVLQFAQLGFGVVALVGTQFDWGSIWIFAAFWAVMGFMQGLNPGVNRPIVAAVVPPELRGAAFALMLSVFEGLAYALFNLVAGLLAEAIGLQQVMFWIPGVLMLVNAAFVTLLYRTYPRDVERLEKLLLARTDSVSTVRS
ncbi:MFS transporter [Curtobacterium sp. VKM Ac-1376]|uniref:MFS transporter n=1 Tax=Curtobacterium sp. VKM Ac-1376 TaxID=123312 RepID=UPI00188D8A82|nr:MFS transporter [Curtobacterium sp. VKM Ac-1376]MBF4614169.1 MFS transporter [Curtobacterium sp. VKM Ac-1376]